MFPSLATHVGTAYASIPVPQPCPSAGVVGAHVGPVSAGEGQWCDGGCEDSGLSALLQGRRGPGTPGQRHGVALGLTPLPRSAYFNFAITGIDSVELRNGNVKCVELGYSSDRVSHLVCGKANFRVLLP